MNLPKRRLSAFTLIELLVVIAIIGILATVSVVALNNARAKSRDSKRVADIKNIQTALAMYYTDKGQYPLTLVTGQPLYSTSLDGAGNVVTTTYISSVPSTPTPADGSNCNTTNNTLTYVTSSDLQSYTLSTCVASPPQTAASSSGAAIYIADPTQSQPCGQYMIDYAGQKYRTVQIGTQCWMRDNLNVGTMVQSDQNSPCTSYSGYPAYTYWSCQVNPNIIEKYCLSNSAINCVNYGGMYEWAEAMGFPYECNGNNATFTNSVSNCGTAASSTIYTKHRGICPPGWHLPANEELLILDTYLKDSTSSCAITATMPNCATAGIKMRVGGSSGFDFPLVGYDYLWRHWSLGVFSALWSTSVSGTGSYQHWIGYGAAGDIYYATLPYYSGRSSGHFVRCLKD